MDPLKVCDLFEESVQISHDDITFALNPGEVDEPEEANQVLLGKIISRHKYGKAAIQGSLKLSWNAISGWKWKEIRDGIIQFTFARREDALNVLARRSWFVCGALIVIMPWPAWLSPAEVRFDKTPMWVHIESIPPFYWNLSNLKELAAKASPVYELPQGIEDAIGMSTLRFRATIDINKPLFSGFFLRRQRLKDLWLQYKYERLPKLCFKCGVLTRDQSVCFKSPTVIKDENGNFYPMFGVWLKSDATEKSTFSSPLAKWFQDWVLQKRLCQDPILRNQMKVHKAIRNGEEAEIRECRRQYPGKKRIVTDDEVIAGDAQPEVVITQLPLVYLPGIEEIAPFGNNSKLVSIQDLQDAAEQYAAAQVAKKKLAADGDLDSPSTLQTATTMGTGGNNTSLVEASPCNSKSTQADIHFEKSVGKLIPNVAENQSRSNMSSPSDESLGPKHSILGTQAQFIDWPSNACWAQPKARDLLMGALTVDKFHREPTLFNPIIDIEDFKVDEHLNGPRKRKASDGLVFRPNTKPNSPPNSTNPSRDLLQQSSAIDTTSPSSNNKIASDKALEKEESCLIGILPDIPIKGSYSPGSNEVEKPPAKRGRGKSKISGNPVEEGTRKRRGRPPKNHSPLAATPKSFKGRKNSKSKLGGNTTTFNHWEDRPFDLKCKVQSSSKFLIMAEISSDPPGINWLLLGTYGPPTRSEKEQSGFTWVPILLLGDMNGTLNDSECFNYNGNASQYAFDFRRMVHRAGLIDLGYLGPSFTWAKGGRNSNGGGALKRARLDRGLASTDWRLLFPNAIVNHLTASESDHRLLLLDTVGGVRCKGQQFKYENMWARDPRSFWVVKDVWKGRRHVNPMLNFHRKVKDTGKKLGNWNKTQFTHLSRQIQIAKSNLQQAERNDLLEEENEDIIFTEIRGQFE
ncbi:hypothetical protein G4B88_018218 [Cannabis sativa]|uniref:DUF4283 domain-containing protein n=1 Tax=Cannabis sativa TaxID=3483 RepID=A0A7J6F812_CANSA|nr:hypothetical protein G4B88_018218 [Cannabis sativa]